MPGRLDGKVALITGGGGGIGEATARLLAEEGARISVVDVDGSAAEGVAAAIESAGGSAIGIEAHLEREGDAAEAVSRTVNRFGGLDVLANIAAVRVWGPITDATSESWQYIVGVNLLAASYCAKFAIPVMAKNGGGSVVNVSSVHAVAGRKGMAQYDATKAGLLSLTRSMACDHAEQGIRVNSVCPGPTLTMYHVRRRAKAGGTSLEEAEAELRAEGAQNLLGRQAEPREIAYPILFLACDEGSYVTGATFMIDGGVSV